MVRVRLGGTWKESPALREAFARGGPAAAEAEGAAVDALSLEIDGVDLAGGRAEGALVPAVQDLCGAVLRLLGGKGRAHVTFSDGGAELLLRRKGPSALVTVVTLERPSRVLARDVEVDLLELAEAVRGAAASLGQDLAAAQRRAEAGAELRELARRLSTARAEPLEVPTAEPGLARRDAGRSSGEPSCSFELADPEDLLSVYRGPGADLGSLLAGGSVQVCLAEDLPRVRVAGPPFLLLRDLAAFAARLVDGMRRGEPTAAVELAAPGRNAVVRLAADLARGTAAWGGAPPVPCAPLLLAAALLEASRDLCDTVTRTNPAQASNAWLAELRGASAEGLGEVRELLTGDLLAERPRPVRARRARALPRAPLGPGAMRHVAFRRAWLADTGEPVGFGLWLAGERLVAAGARGVLGLDPATGSVAWSRPPAAFATAAGTTVHLGGAGEVAAVDAVSGVERWSRALDGLPEGVADAVPLAGGHALLLAPGAAAALGPSGATAWTFEPPGAPRLRASQAGPLALVVSDRGFLYALAAASGELAWRVRLPGPAVASPLTLGGAILVLCSTAIGGSLVAFDLASGQRRFELPLDVTPLAGAVSFAGLLAIPASVAGDGLVLAADPAGRLAWEDAPPLGPGPLGLAALPGGLLLAASPVGSCVALDRLGEARWTSQREGTLGLRGAPAPVAARGLALVPGERTLALDTATGRELGDAGLTSPVRLLANGALNAWGMDADGIVTAVRLETHLSVL